MAARRGSALFVCVANSGRSQVAEAFAKKNHVKASSAGTMPAQSVNPVVVEVMKEKGIDLSSTKAKMLTVGMIGQADLVITTGCSVEEVCPRPMLAKMKNKLDDWNLADAEGKSVEEVRGIRDEMQQRVNGLL